MPERQTLRRAQTQARRGRRPSTQAGEFVREEMRHIRRGKHGARSTKQAIAIGLSKARRAGVRLPPPRRGTQSEEVRRKARRELARGTRRGRASPTRGRAITGALRREGRRAATRRALGRQARTAARRRGPALRSQAARKAVRTKGRAGLRAAARKAARTRAGR